MNGKHLLALLGASVALMLATSATASAATIMSCTISGDTANTLSPVFPALDDLSKIPPHLGDYTYDGDGQCTVPVGSTGLTILADATLHSEGHYWTYACQSGWLYDDDDSPFGRDSDGLTSTTLTLKTTPQATYNFAYTMSVTGTAGDLSITDFTPAGQGGIGVGVGKGTATVIARDAAVAPTTCQTGSTGVSFAANLVFTITDTK